jgi:hypothetical protein
MIKSNYVDYKIVMAISVNQDKRNIWVVNLEVSKDYIIVREEEGNQNRAFLPVA